MQLPDDLQDLLTVKEVAALLRVDTSYIYRLIRKGQLPALRPGPHKTRIAKVDLQAFLTASYTSKNTGGKQ